jgi:uncharacterized membrane protein YagU involved in acid resistance
MTTPPRHSPVEKRVIFYLSRNHKKSDPGKTKYNLNREDLILEYTLKDRVILGGISGALGVLIRDMWSYFAKEIGLAKFYVWQRSADLFIDGKELRSFFGNLVGVLADTIFGALLGITFVYFLKWTNHKNIVIKGWGFGIAAWLFLFAMLVGSLPGTQTTIPKDALSNFSAFIGHSIWGISTGLLAKILLTKFEV